MGLNENTTRATHAAKTRSMRTLASFYGAVFSQNDLAPLPPSALYCPPSRGGLIHELRRERNSSNFVMKEFLEVRVYLSARLSLGYPGTDLDEGRLWAVGPAM
jgi:hypothetical protein